MKTYNCIDQTELFENYPQFEDALYLLSEVGEDNEPYFNVYVLDQQISEVSDSIREDGYSDSDLVNSLNLLESLNALKIFLIDNKIDRVIWNYND